MEPVFSTSSNDLVRRWVGALSRIPVLFDGLRWGLEGGFRTHTTLLQRNFPRRDLRILDCGCGTGIYAKLFSPSGYVGIDVSVPYLDRARKLNPEYRFDLMDAMDMKFDDGTFDAVFISGLIHHLPSDEAKTVLSEVQRVLDGSGVLLLWEDVPTRSRLNLVGRLVHLYDMGSFIRPASEYAALLDGKFNTESTEEFRSCFMDYSAFRCRPLTLSKENRT